MRYISYPYFAYPYYHPHWLAVNNQGPAQTNHPESTENLFPPINTDRLNKSAHSFRELMRQADLLIDKIISNPAFSNELMNAAQLSNKKKVQELVRSAGITIKGDINYHPSGIRIELDNSESRGNCCKLQIALSW